ncbi:MAG: isopentenyl-diphosphate Delta-isomerase [Bacteroidia bacterium]
MNSKVILVDESDKAIGEMDKLEVHQKGLLHRAFSIFIFNDAGLLLLQCRADEKYHSGGLWTNTCCGHPQPGEETAAGAVRRLQEETGIVTELRKKFSFIYHAPLEQNLFEHEYDHVFTGICNREPLLNKEEASAYRWISLSDLKKEMKDYPERFTAWFKIAITSF